MGSANYRQAGTISTFETEPTLHAPAKGARPVAKLAQPITGAVDAYRRQLASAQAKLEDLVADRAALLAKIETLEHEIRSVHRIPHYDELTGLPGRQLLADRYAMAVARSERQRDSIALLFIDIDGFKQVNDSFGHAVGDGILRQVADRLVACVRATDTACRYGGDEFVVLLSDNHARSDAASIAAQIREIMSLKFVVDAVDVSLTVSIGIAMYPSDGPELCKLVRAADAQMYRAKRADAPNR
jgi:diguanylate cyclase (GGDEF)-like protein